MWSHQTNRADRDLKNEKNTKDFAYNCPKKCCHHMHWRRTGLNSVGASISTTSGRGRKRGTLICIISGRGRKTVGAIAPTAPISSAPLTIDICIYAFGCELLLLQKFCSIHNLYSTISRAPIRANINQCLDISVLERYLFNLELVLFSV